MMMRFLSLLLEYILVLIDLHRLLSWTTSQAVPPHFVGDEPMEEMIAPHELGVDGADEDHDDPDTADSESSSDGNAWYPLTAFSPDHPVGEPNRLK